MRNIDKEELDSINVKFELHFAFFHKVQLEVDRILKETTLKLKMKEE